VAEGSRAGDGDRSLRQRSPVEANEALPGYLVAQCTGVGQSKLRKAQGTEKSGFLGNVGMSAGRKTVIKLCAYGGKSAAELVDCKAAGLRFGKKPELLSNGRRKHGRRLCLKRSWSGFLSGRHWQEKIAGLGSRVHALEDTASVGLLRSESTGSASSRQLFQPSGPGW
jgi:hypothetical protein